MPLYEYRCHQCGKTFEIRQKFAEAPLTVHEGCGGGLERIIFASALQFKGSGFYVNDYGRGVKSRPTNGSNANAKSESESKNESKSDSKSDSRSESKSESKSDSRSESKSDSKSDSKSESKPGSKPESKGQSQPSASTSPPEK